MFDAILLTREDGSVRATLTELDEAQLPAGEVDLRVEYSTLNYKDALAITGRGAVVRRWPMVPGIDLAGVVEASRSPAWSPGERVVVTGWGLGETHWGGLAQKARVPADWLLALPEAYGTRQAMAIGTAGFTAALCVLALRRHGLAPGDGEILVTGAAGGVGSIAVALAAGRSRQRPGNRGRPQEAAYLESLGAAAVIERAALAAPGGKPLASERWAGVIDTVGSHTLVNACAATRWNGAVAACGLAQGPDFPGTVLPFILRGVTLYGINSVYVPNEKRREAWALLAAHLDAAKLERLTVEIGLSQVIAYAPDVLAGKVRGRTVVDVNR
jgi:acrylyl-CoA reductase (NADPH)